MAQTITVNGTPMLVSDDISFPFWLESGSSISPEVPVSSISVLEFNIVPNNNGNDMVFNQVISVTEGQTVPEGKTWKVESILMENQGFDSELNSNPNLIDNGEYLSIHETGLHIKFYEPDYVSSISNVILKADILPGGGGDISHSGFCYSKNNSSPNLNDQSWFSEGYQIGTTVITNLAVGYQLETDQTYYVRAFVSNSEGVTYSDTYQFETHSYYVGMEHEGGYIFYIDSTNSHGYIYNNNYKGPYSFSCNDQINTYDEIFGNGSYNTSVLIQSNCLPSGLMDEIYSSNGYSDWFIPSRIELELLCTYNTHSYYSFISDGSDKFPNYINTNGITSNYDDEFYSMPDELELQFYDVDYISSTSQGTTSNTFYKNNFYNCNGGTTSSARVYLIREF